MLIITKNLLPIRIDLFIAVYITYQIVTYLINNNIPSCLYTLKHLFSNKRSSSNSRMNTRVATTSVFPYTTLFPL